MTVFFSIESNNDNNNGLVVQARSSLPALRLRLLHPADESDHDDLGAENRVENNCSGNVCVSQASKDILTGESVGPKIRNSSLIQNRS